MANPGLAHDVPLAVGVRSRRVAQALSAPGYQPTRTRGAPPRLDLVGFARPRRALISAPTSRIRRRRLRQPEAADESSLRRRFLMGGVDARVVLSASSTYPRPLAT